MDDPKTYIAIAAALIALGSLWMAILTRRDSGKSAKSAAADAAAANARADEANASAARAASAVERVAIVQETVLADRKRAEAEQSPWRLEWRYGDLYKLTNDSSQTIWEVVVMGQVLLEGSQQAYGRRLSISTMRGYEATTFKEARGSRPSESDVVQVICRFTPAGDHQSWSTPLPVRET